jgi:hypothetical protein
MGHNESDRSDCNDDLEVPNLEEALSMLEKQGNRVCVLFHAVLNPKSSIVNRQS